MAQTQAQLESEIYRVSKLVTLEMDEVVPYNSIMGEDDGSDVCIDALCIVKTLAEVPTLKVGQHVTLNTDPENQTYHDGGEQRLEYYLNGKSGTIVEIEEYEPL